MSKRALFAVLAAASLGALPDASAATPEGARHERGADGMFWFMHISDAHIGATALVSGEHAKEHLTFALNEAVSVINPSFVWATGDLNDGSGKIGIDGVGVPTSGQSQTQWDWYKEIYTNAGMRVGFYYDLVGNHDVYGDDGATFYLANSLWGSTQHKTWMDFTITTATGDYCFFGLNSTNNYFQPLTNSHPSFLDDEIAQLDASLKSHANAKLVFVAAHHSLDGNGDYPTDKADQVRALLRPSRAFYLHGDMHHYTESLDSVSTTTVVNEVASLGEDDTSNIAIGVVDHDAFIYRATDVASAWPFVILTAPVSRTLRSGGDNPWAYSVCKNRRDNPFRAITFSASAPTHVTVKVGTLPMTEMSPVKKTFDPAFPVWEGDVDTRTLDAGPVDVTVSVEADGRTNLHTISAQFDDRACPALAGDPPSNGASSGGGGSAILGGDAGDASDAGDPPSTAGGDAPEANAAGCACRAGAPAGGSGAGAGLGAGLGAVALAGARMRRRARQTRAATARAARAAAGVSRG
jgi:hypothetical protein